MHKRYIITGAPGTGKTSLLNALKKSGYPCSEEISRKIIANQQAIGGNKTPWGDMRGFVDLVYHQTRRELQYPINQHMFVDRGLPDSIAYLHTKACGIPDDLINFSYKKYYATTVFLAPPWQQIYINDPQRLQSEEEALLIHKQLVSVYKRLKFNIVALPKTTLTKRVAFIQSFI